MTCICSISCASLICWTMFHQSSDLSESILFYDSCCSKSWNMCWTPLLAIAPTCQGSLACSVLQSYSQWSRNPPNNAETPGVLQAQSPRVQAAEWLDRSGFYYTFIYFLYLSIIWNCFVWKKNYGSPSSPQASKVTCSPWTYMSSLPAGERSGEAKLWWSSSNMKETAPGISPTQIGIYFIDVEENDTIGYYRIL